MVRQQNVKVKMLVREFQVAFSHLGLQCAVGSCPGLYGVDFSCSPSSLKKAWNRIKPSFLLARNDLGCVFSGFDFNSLFLGCP